MSGGLREILQEIYDRRGKLTPEIVRDEARPDDSPLHHALTWDDAVAGEEYRLIQAHRLIQRVRITYRSSPKARERDVRAFQAVRTGQGYVYEPTEKVAQDPFLAHLVLADMEREWRALKRRYEDFREFWTMVRRDVGGSEAA